MPEAQTESHTSVLDSGGNEQESPLDHANVLGT